MPPQGALPDEDPLCCCEYFNRRGERAHCLACCCECDALDQAADAIFSGRRPGKDRIDTILAELDDRLRLPTPGGAWHVGLPRAVPWAVLPPLLLLGSISARTLLLAGAVLLPSVAWWHFRTLRLRRRSQFLLSWQLASLACECAVILLILPATADAGTLAFAVAAAATLLLLARCKLCNVSSLAGIADAAGASARAVVCPVSGISVPRYDHYCAWIDEPVGAANHRPFVLFLVCMLATCLLGMGQLMRLHPSSETWAQLLQANRSSLFLACFAYGLIIAVCVASLLAHQLHLLWSGSTTHEERRRRRRRLLAGEVGSAPRECGVRLRQFGEQTAPLLLWAGDAGRRALGQECGSIVRFSAASGEGRQHIPEGGKTMSE
jgi:palmitoyltransferase